MAADNWHALSARDVAKALRSVPSHGLTERDAALRLAQYGANRLESTEHYRMLRIILRLLSSPLSFILVIVGGITAYLHEWVDTAVVLLVLVINVAIGTFQEGRARKVFDVLAASQEKRALVLRDGKRAVIKAEEVVPGDILILEGGAAVPADARLLQAEELSVNEAPLTGEWVSVSKQTEPVSPEVPLAERDCMVWSGTNITSGHGMAIVVATGKETAIGEIAEHLSDKPAETKLEASVKHLARVLMLGIGVVIFAITLLGIVRGEPLADILLIAVALAVAVMPEGLPAAVTVVLAVGMEVILKKGGLVRSLNAAETLGSTTTIITDKTGTLTEGVMAVSALYTTRSMAQEDRTLAHTDNQELLKEAILASDAFTTETPEGIAVHGRPVEKALLTAGIEAGISQDDLFAHGGERLTYLQFESARRYGASLNLHGTGRKRIYMTGSPEVFLDVAAHAGVAGASRVMDEETRERFRNVQRQESARGNRFIALAYIETEGKDIPEGVRAGKVPKSAVFVGLIAFSDRIRSDVASEIQRARDAGIRVIMATGDFPETARAIAQEVGIAHEETRVVTGSDVEGMDDAELVRVLYSGAVFSRVVPEQKLRMVRVLRGEGEVVAMTGDGVNDAPALIAADIGVAVESGTDVAKEASDIILLNNTFSTITAAIAEGRRIGDNLRKIVAYLLSTSFSEIVFIGGALAVGAPLPLLPAQILFANVIEEGLMSFPFAFEPREKDAMRRKPNRDAGRMILTGSMWKLIIWATAVTSILLGVLYYILASLGTPIEETRTVLFIALTFDALLFTFSFKDLHRPLWRINLFSNKWILVALGANIAILLFAITFPPLASVLSLTPLSMLDIGLLALLGLGNLLTIELGKLIFFR